MRGEWCARVSSGFVDRHPRSAARDDQVVGAGGPSQRGLRFERVRVVGAVRDFGERLQTQDGEEPRDRYPVLAAGLDDRDGKLACPDEPVCGVARQAEDLPGGDDVGGDTQRSDARRVPSPALHLAGLGCGVARCPGAAMIGHRAAQRYGHSSSRNAGPACRGSCFRTSRSTRTTKASSNNPKRPRRS
jgi:hypothetical protein